MELTVEQFELITGLTHQPPIYDGVEKRKHPRVAFGSRARMYPLVPAVCPDGRSVLVRDISLSGVGLLFSDALAIGDEIILKLPAQRGEPLVVHCMVQRCETGGSHGKQFVIGVTFEQVLDTSVLTDDSMLDSPLVKSAIANLSTVWRATVEGGPAVAAGPITRAVSSVWKRLTGVKRAEPVVESIPQRFEVAEPAVVESEPVAAENTVSRSSRLFATANTPAAMIEAPAVAETNVVEPVAASVAVEPAPAVEKAPVAQAVIEPAVEPAPIARPVAKIEPVQDVMWMPDAARPRANASRPRASVHRIGSRHPRRCFGRK